VFRKVELTTSLKTKQLRAGLEQLGEEGAIQIFHPLEGSAPILGAVGQLQFEVVVYRLAHEYGAQVRLTPVSYYGARWVSGEPAELERLIAAYPHLMAKDGAGVLAFLAPSKFELERRQEQFDKLRFHALREYAGLEEEAPV
jgi:peptide chain release factor 3